MGLTPTVDRGESGRGSGVEEEVEEERLEVEEFLDASILLCN